MMRVYKCKYSVARNNSIIRTEPTITSFKDIYHLQMVECLYDIYKSKTFQLIYNNIEWVTDPFTNMVWL